MSDLPSTDGSQPIEAPVAPPVSEPETAQTSIPCSDTPPDATPEAPLGYLPNGKPRQRRQRSDAGTSKTRAAARVESPRAVPQTSAAPVADAPRVVTSNRVKTAMVEVTQLHAYIGNADGTQRTRVTFPAMTTDELMVALVPHLKAVSSVIGTGVLTVQLLAEIRTFEYDPVQNAVLRRAVRTVSPTPKVTPPRTGNFGARDTTYVQGEPRE